MARNDMGKPDIGKRVNSSNSKLTFQKKAIDHNPAQRTVPMANGGKNMKSKSSDKGGY